MSVDLSRPLVIADGHALPFRDRAFAYVNASHVLEHASDPIRFAAELSRIAPRGYVEMPTREAELTFGWPFHPWLVDREGDTLIFSAKEADAPCGSFFHRQFPASPLLQLWMAHRSTWVHGVDWSGTLGVRVEGPSTPGKTARFDLSETIVALERLARASALRPLSDQLWETLTCPACGASVAREVHSTLTCRGCATSYQSREGRPSSSRRLPGRQHPTPRPAHTARRRRFV